MLTPRATDSHAPRSRLRSAVHTRACVSWQAYRLAAYLVRRLHQQASALYPQLATGGPRGAAAARELLHAVERAGFGAMRRSLGGLLTERRSDEQARYR